MADVKGNQAAMVGSNKNPPELPFPEDSSLNYACPTKATIRRPQGVKTMEECLSRGQALGRDLQDGPRPGSQVPLLHDEPSKPDQPLGTELPELCQGHEPGRHASL